MAILAYDDVMLREPALLLPNQPPVGLCKPNPSHRAARHLIYGVTGKAGQPELKWGSAFVGGAITRGRNSFANNQKTTIGNFDTLGLGNTCMVLYGRILNAAPTNDGMAFGYNDSASDRLLCHLPFSDGTVYWDFGNATSGSGRLSAAGQPFVVGAIDWWLFVADPTIGREIWRNGKLLASNASATATRLVENAAASYNGTNEAVTGFSHTMLGFYVFNGLVSDRASLSQYPNELLIPA